MNLLEKQLRGSLRFLRKALSPSSVSSQEKESTDEKFIEVKRETYLSRKLRLLGISLQLWTLKLRIYWVSRKVQRLLLKNWRKQ